MLYRELNGVHIESTLHGMATLSDDTKSVIIGITGLYRITVVLDWNGCIGVDNSWFGIKINDTYIFWHYSGQKCGYGTMDRIVQLQKGDKIGFYSSKTFKTEKRYNSFTLQKLNE